MSQPGIMQCSITCAHMCTATAEHSSQCRQVCLHTCTVKASSAGCAPCSRSSVNRSMCCATCSSHISNESSSMHTKHHAKMLASPLASGHLCDRSLQHHAPLSQHSQQRTVSRATSSTLSSNGRFSGAAIRLLLRGPTLWGPGPSPGPRSGL